MKVTDTPQRAWIEQPSELQPHYELHGTNVLAMRSKDYAYTRHALVFFLSGGEVCTLVPEAFLSPGWLPE